MKIIGDIVTHKPNYYACSGVCRTLSEGDVGVLSVRVCCDYVDFDCRSFTGEDEHSCLDVVCAALIDVFAYDWGVQYMVAFGVSVQIRHF